jgi:signal transduction histidine kinase/ligand-binding sensor domain-containing protein
LIGQEGPAVWESQLWQVQGAGSNTRLCSLLGMKKNVALVAWWWVMLGAAGTCAGADPLLETLTGTSPEFVVTNWRMQQGLPSDRAREVLQTRDGYVWLATFNGAAQFDGVRFRVFNDANTPALRNSLVNCLFEDAEGRLWLGSDTGEVTWRDAAGFHALAAPDSWRSSPIDRFAQARDGTLWIRNRDGFLLRVRDLKTEAILGNLAGPLYSDVVSDSEGQVWAVRFGGTLARLTAEGEAAAGAAPEPPRSYRTVAAARKGGLWVRDGNRLRRWYRGNWVENRGIHVWGARQAVVLYEASNGDVWIGTREDGAFVATADGPEHHINRANGLAHDLVSSICEDREGNIWVSSDGGGLSMLRPRAVFMVRPPDMWQHRPIWSVSPSLDGGLWVGTEGAGVYKMKGEQFTQLSASNSPTAKDVRTALEDRGGRLWVGVEVRERLINGLLVQDPQGRLWVGTQGAGLLVGEKEKLHPLTPADTGVLMPALFYAAYQSRDGALWLGSNSGLLRFQQGHWSRLGTELYRFEVRCITETPDGAIWIGMRGGGVARYQNGQFTQFLRAQGLPYEYAWALLGDADGSLWIGTPGAGLIRWRQGHFDSFTTRQGLPSDFICSIQSDSQGHLWLGSYGGVLRVAKAELERCARGEAASVHCCVLDGSDGLTSLEMAGGNQPSACTTPDGRLWFATSGGLAMVDPTCIRTNALPPPVGLEEVLVDGKALRPDPASPSSSLLRVPPGSGQIELRYTALSFCAPQRVRFRYRLEKVDDGWVEAGARRSAYYDHLRPGHYRFQVIACNNDGVWNPEGAAVKLLVLPHLWQTWWFAPCCWLAGVGGVGTGVLTTLRRRHRAQLEVLERARLLERERGRIARDLHDDLGSGLTDISTTSALGLDASVPVEEAREYLGEIRQRSNEMVMALDEIVWAVNPKNDHLGSLATYFSQFTEELLRRTPLRCHFEIPGQLPHLSLNAEQRHSLFLAFKQALQNALTHAGASHLRIGIAVEAGLLRIILEDNGHGFEAGAPKPGADGLRNMRERLEQLGGRCEILAAPGKGTRVTFEVPVQVPA